MAEQPTHIISARTDYWTKDEYITPGLVAPKDRSHEHYRGTVEDCDRIAEGKGITFLVDDFPPSEETPIHYRFYMQPTDDDPPGIRELWCSARMIDRDTPWVTSLPLVADVFPENNPHAEFAQQMFDAALMRESSVSTDLLIPDSRQPQVFDGS